MTEIEDDNFGIDIRNNALNNIKKYTELIDDESKDLEIGIYNWAIDYCTRTNMQPYWKNDVFMNIYNSKLVLLLSKLDVTSDSYTKCLYEKIKDRTYKPHDLANLEEYELDPDKYNQVLTKKLEYERNELNHIDSNTGATTELFKCFKCKQRKCSYYELQIRSADEPATIFISCLNPKCKNKWRIG